MKQVRSQEDIISEFIELGNGIKKITKRLTHENCIGCEREVGKKHPIDIVATTENCKVGYEVYYNVPEASNAIHKIKQRKENKKAITHWAALVLKTFVR